MTESVVVEPDGWISAELDDGLHVHVHVTNRDVDEMTTEIVIDGLYVAAPEITTDTLRSVHPARIVAEGFDRTMDQHVTSLLGGAGTQEERRSLTRLFGHAITINEDDAGLTLGSLRGRAAGRRIIERRRELLGRPGTDPAKLDAFYQRVADAYTSATAASGRPAAVLAEENDVPVGTVHRWVKEARRRGHLPPGRRGRAG